jgi:hypothetical protein
VEDGFGNMRASRNNRMRTRERCAVYVFDIYSGKWECIPREERVDCQGNCTHMKGIMERASRAVRVCQCEK